MFLLERTGTDYCGTYFYENGPERTGTVHPCSKKHSLVKEILVKLIRTKKILRGGIFLCGYEVGVWLKEILEVTLKFQNVISDKCK